MTGQYSNKDVNTIAKVCSLCDELTVPRTYSVLIKTENPKIYKLKTLQCRICENCWNIFLASDDDIHNKEIAVVCKEMDKILDK